MLNAQASAEKSHNHLDAIPNGALNALRDLDVPFSMLHPVEKLGVTRPVCRWVSADDRIVIEAAIDKAGSLRIARELHGRQWARQHGIPTATVLAADAENGWLVGEWVPGHSECHVEPPVDHAEFAVYLDAAIGMAMTIAAAAPSVDGPPAEVWRAPKRAVVLRLLRAAAAGLPLRLWWSARQAAAALPRVPVAHGDYYHRNVLWKPDSGASQLCVVDWEYLGDSFRYGDLVRLWSVLPHRWQREQAMARILATVPEAEHGEIGTLALWLALRRLGENIKAPRRQRNAADTAHAWSVLPEAQNLARGLNVSAR